MSSVIETSGLSKSFGQVRAVDSVSLRVEAGGDLWLRWPERRGQDHNDPRPVGHDPPQFGVGRS